jgi:uncharacterized phage protein (TIGR02218 family)
MKALPAGLQTFLDQGETTMVHCWKVTRSDGLIQGFTEHDVDLTFASVTYKAASGFTASQIESSIGLSVDNLNAEGALSDDTINEDDLAAGRYDDALVELYWVNFNDVAQRVLLSKGNIGQVKRGEYAFSAELRSQTNRLQQRTGRSYQRTCDAILGDSRCKKNLAAFTDIATVSSVEDNRRMTISGLANSGQANFYTQGVLEFQTGGNAGLRFEIKAHSGNVIVLWERPPFPISVSDGVQVVAGCDKSIATCDSKFANTTNFQGFNLIPGSDYITRYANRDGSQSGESIFND